MGGRSAKRPQLSIQFTRDQLAVLRGIAVQNGVPLATVARWAFEHYLNCPDSGRIVAPPAAREAVPA